MTEAGVFEQTPEGGEGTSPWTCLPGQARSPCKCTEVGRAVAVLEKRQGGQRDRGRTSRGEPEE